MQPGRATASLTLCIAPRCPTVSKAPQPTRTHNYILPFAGCTAAGEALMHVHRKVDKSFHPKSYNFSHNHYEGGLLGGLARFARWVGWRPVCMTCQGWGRDQQAAQAWLCTAAGARRHVEAPSACSLTPTSGRTPGVSNPPPFAAHKGAESGRACCSWPRHAPLRWRVLRCTGRHPPTTAALLRLLGRRQPSFGQSQYIQPIKCTPWPH